MSIHVKRLLIATDFSAFSDQALSLGHPLLAKGGRVRLFHGVSPVLVPVLASPDSAVSVYDPVATKVALKQAAKHLKALAQGLRGIKVDWVVAESSRTALAIAAEAKKFKADLVCMSTHGRSGWSRLLYGSVAQKFLAHYRGAVLLFRPPARSKKAP